MKPMAAAQGHERLFTESISSVTAGKINGQIFSRGIANDAKNAPVTASNSAINLGLRLAIVRVSHNSAFYLVDGVFCRLGILIVGNLSKLIKQVNDLFAPADEIAG